MSSDLVADSHRRFIRKIGMNFSQIWNFVIWSCIFFNDKLAGLEKKIDEIVQQRSSQPNAPAPQATASRTMTNLGEI